MSESLRADVIVPICDNLKSALRCLAGVLEYSEETLRSLIVIDNASPELRKVSALRRLADSDQRVRLFHNKTALGLVATCNRGLAECAGDAVLLRSNTQVTRGWLRELAEVAHLD